MKKLLIYCSLVLLLSACGSDHILRFNLAQHQDVRIEPSYEGRSHFFLWGMFQKTGYDLANLCYGRGIKAIETHWTFYDSMMNSFTMGIYAPESFSIYCN